MVEAIAAEPDVTRWAFAAHTGGACVAGRTAWCSRRMANAQCRRRTEPSRVWDLERGEALRTLEGHTDAVSAVALTPDGKRAVSAS